MRPSVYAPVSAPLAVATSAARSTAPFGSQRNWMMKLPRMPIYATTKTVPAIVAIVRPGRWNCALSAMNANMTTATNVQSGQAKAWMGAEAS